MHRKRSIKGAGIAGALLLQMLLLSSCSTMPVAGGSADAQLPAGAAPAADAAADNYTLGPEDTVRIIVDGHTEWSGEYVIKPNGEIFIPNIGTFRAAGMDKEGFADALSEQLQKYIRNPRVEIDIVKYVSQVIYVLGEVGRPGEYPTQGKNITLRDAVIQAGLPTRFAAQGRVFIISPSQGKPERRVVNLERVLNRGELGSNIEVRPGEIVYVPKNILGVIADFFSAILSPITSTASTVAVTAK